MNKTRNPPFLEVHDLGLEYRSAAGTTQIVQDISFTLARGEILGVIGESGAGKSTLGNALLGLLDRGFRQSAGTIELGGHIVSSREPSHQNVRKGVRVSAIFQDHTASLDPLMRVGNQIEETVIAAHPGQQMGSARARALHLLERVGISDPASRYDDYPHQFSGGQRQRIVIAIALASFPDIIVADEPTSALDATVQKQILSLLRRMVDETGVAVILVTHDMGVISEIADRVLVMKRGSAIEYGPTDTILDTPKTEYTRRLLAAVPKLHIKSNNSSDGATQGERMERSAFAADLVSKTFHHRGLFSRLKPNAGKLALCEASISVDRGQIVGIVGQSGSGKSTLGRIMAGLERASSGRVIVNDDDFDVAQSAGQRALLGRVQMIFQDPSVSLNPRMTVNQTLNESVRYGSRRHDHQKLVAAMLDRLGLPLTVVSRYPHELSGGQKQRVCIGRALLANPSAVIADEPTSALDVSVQAEILTLLKEAVAENGIAMVFISHDLAVVQSLCSFVHILKDGRIVDRGPADRVFSHSENPYTRALLDARPSRFTH